MAQDQKRDAIIEAAIKRFAHFGVSKTTMSEIAADLSFSKASLYYYFPDKLNLFAAVVNRLTKSGSEGFSDEVTKEKDPFKAILLFLETRTNFIIRYYNILEYLRTVSHTTIPAELQPDFAQLKNNELRQIVNIIDKGVQSGLFKIKDTKKAAALFFDFMEGFRYAILLKSPKLFPDKKQFQAILKRELEFAMIFFNGLTIKKD